MVHQLRVVEAGLLAPFEVLRMAPVDSSLKSSGPRVSVSSRSR
jgi:hypothetical protein